MCHLCMKLSNKFDQIKCITRAVLVFACRPPPASSEEGELRSAVFCQVTGVHLMCQIFMNDLLTEQGKQRSRGIR